MLEEFINFLCALIMACSGFYIIKKIRNSEEKICLKYIIILIINSLFIVMIHYLNYNAISVLLNFIINTVTYKMIFKSSIEEAVISTAILTIIIIVADVIDIFIQILFVPSHLLQNNIYIYLMGNIIVAIISLLLIHISFLQKNTNKFYQILLSKDLKLNILFVLLVIVGISGIGYNLILNYRFNFNFFSNILIMSSLIFTSVIFVRNRETYNQLSRDYDILMENVQTFEEWIEKEQYNRHEHKNQLAILYALSTEQKVKDKIQEMIDQNIEIENDMIHSLRRIPKGGLKGILYYKIIVAQKHKINLTIDVSVKEKGIFQKLNSKKMNELSKVTGIYFDNAIEAASESRKKRITVEIYELKDKIQIVISNTFKKGSILENNGNKGVSSKGPGRGNGLYFASKIIRSNQWLQEKHEIIDRYYVETISITKNTSK